METVKKEALSNKISGQEKSPIIKDTQIQSRNKTLKLLIIFVLGISIIGTVIYVIVKFTKQPSQEKTVKTGNIAKITIQPSFEPPKNLAKLQIGKIAFVQDENLFLLDSSGVKQVTTAGKVGKLKWSIDGKYIGWISQKEFSYKNSHKDYEWTKKLGISLSFVELATNKITEIVKQDYSDEQLRSREGYKLTLSGFDFSNDSTKIVYVHNGVWLKDINTGEVEKIADNYLGDTDWPVDDRTYVDVNWNRKSDIILLYQSVWDCGRTELYNLQTKKTEEVNIGTCNSGIWSMDGKYIISYTESGQEVGGLWLTSIIDKSTKKIVADEKYPRSVISAAVSSKNQLAAIIEPFPSPDSDNNLPIKGTAIYLVNYDGVLTPIKKLEENQNKYFPKGLGWSPNGNQITVLYSRYNSGKQKEQFDLYILNRDGTDMTLLITGISAYQWSAQ